MLFSNLFSRNTAYHQMIFLVMINVTFNGTFTVCFHNSRLHRIQFYSANIGLGIKQQNISPAAIPSKQVFSALE